MTEQMKKELERVDAAMALGYLLALGWRPNVDGDWVYTRPHARVTVPRHVIDQRLRDAREAGDLELLPLLRALTIEADINDRRAN